MRNPLSHPVSHHITFSYHVSLALVGCDFVSLTFLVSDDLGILRMSHYWNFSPQFYS